MEMLRGAIGNFYFGFAIAVRGGCGGVVLCHEDHEGHEDGKN